MELVKEINEWVNSFVIGEKKVPVDYSSAHPLQHSVQKKLSICLDPRDLNEAFEREPYYTRSIEEILGKFHGMTQFTIADFNMGYCMVELPSGIKEMDNCGTMADDMIIYGKTDHEHDGNLLNFLEIGSSNESNDPVVPTTPRWSTHSNKVIPQVRFTPSKK